MSVDVAQDLTLAPSAVNVTNGDHVPFTRSELELYAVLHLFTARLGSIGEHEARAHEESCVADAFACAEPVQVGFLFLNLYAAHRIDAQPCRKRESVLIRPIANGRQ